MFTEPSAFLTTISDSPVSLLSPIYHDKEKKQLKVPARLDDRVSPYIVD